MNKISLEMMKTEMMKTLFSSTTEEKALNSNLLAQFAEALNIIISGELENNKVIQQKLMTLPRNIITPQSRFS